MKILKGLLLFLIIVGCAQMSVTTLTKSEDEYARQYKIGRVHNREAVELPDWGDAVNISQRYIFQTQYDQVPSKPIPVHKLTIKELEELPNDQISVIRFGHSTVLLKIDGDFWLTDPVFSDRLGPVYFMGIERFHDVPLSISELPDIRGVLISHNHYDHLDERTIRVLHPKVQHFIVPIGNGHDLIDWGVEPRKITELDWWENKSVGDLTLIATPANHISGRILIDQNEALWSSWVIISKEQRIFFSGDGGYSDIYEKIGDKFGPFDLTIMENGSYDKCWSKEHLTPEETIQAHQDLKGDVLMPVHNSTFDMAFHSWYEPLNKVSQIADKQGISLLAPVIGKPFTFNAIDSQSMLTSKIHWWEDMVSKEVVPVLSQK
mgnify:FL=1